MMCVDQPDIFSKFQCLKNIEGDQNIVDFYFLFSLPLFYFGRYWGLQDLTMCVI